MRRVFIFSVLIVLLLANVSIVTAGSKWYSGGTLHKATVWRWKNATYTNKLATAADWCMNIPSIKKSRNRNIENLRPYAIQLMRCVDEACAGQGYEKMRVSKVAASCLILMGYNL